MQGGERHRLSGCRELTPAKKNTSGVQRGRPRGSGRRNSWRTWRSPPPFRLLRGGFRARRLSRGCTGGKIENRTDQHGPESQENQIAKLDHWRILHSTLAPGDSAKANHLQHALCHFLKFGLFLHKTLPVYWMRRAISSTTGVENQRVCCQKFTQGRQLFDFGSSVSKKETDSLAKSISIPRNHFPACRACEFPPKTPVNPEIRTHIYSKYPGLNASHFIGRCLRIWHVDY